MAQSSETGTRVMMIILLLIYITVLYTLEGIYIVGMENQKEIDTSSIILEELPNIDNPENYTYGTQPESFNPLDFVFGFFGFLAFQPLGLPAWASAILTFTVLISGVAMGILVYVFVRDWIPLI